ncbi:general substrate transporter [Nadsonia fulvescens var. elongata DSM 6958]|uniref:General substrate transporter n=1 Tax=Nadsonia fulvescens var. elongata DSM 6958 TaxID=857566 RepID=A0A1E3PU86_9ASCO|nr:general substrate transporter [Nadsonia fulvescens var. elongata DSM 6958]
MTFMDRFKMQTPKQEGSQVMAIFVAAFAAFGGILYGYDTGTISGILTMDYVRETFPDTPGTFTAGESSLITSILSVGTFAGALSAPLASDTLGRRLGLMIACVIFSVGVLLQTITTGKDLLIAGRVIAGFGVGNISSIVPLYQSEAAPKWIRGAIVCGYQWAITIGLLLAAIVNNATQHRNDTGSYRIPIAVQFAWALILFFGMLVLPETPRFWVKSGKIDKATKSLSTLRGLPEDHEIVLEELSEIQASYEMEMSMGSSSVMELFTKENRQLKRMLTGAGVQALQQLTGVNFIFYYGTAFFKSAGIENSFTVNIITNVVNVVCSVPGMVGVELLGRRTLLLAGSVGMSVSQLIVAVVGSTIDSEVSNKCLIAFSCIFIGCFAATWGPVPWVIVGEIFPLRVRGKAVALCAAVNWLFNFAIAYATPFLVDSGPGNANLGSKVFFIWCGCNTLSFFFVFFLVYETKNMSLEEIDAMYDNCSSAIKSIHYVPEHHSFKDTDYESEEKKMGDIEHNEIVV